MPAIRVIPVLVAAGAAASSALSATADLANRSSTVLWFRQPANDWQSEALPIGNGSFGAMIFGGVDAEHLQLNVDSLWTGDLNPSGDYASMGAYQNLADVTIALGAGSSGVTCPSGHKPFYTTEGVEKTIDGADTGKWCIVTEGRPVAWQISLPEGEEAVVSSYSLTSADDVPDRDPKNWSLTASHDGESWIELDRRTDEPRFAERHERRTYTFANTQAYRFYRLTFDSNHGASHFQLSEIKLEGVAFEDTTAGEYERELDLTRALHRVRYRQGGVTLTREMFASHADQVMVVRLTADQPGQYSGLISIADAHDAPAVATPTRITIAGTLANGLMYETQVRVQTDGGRLEAEGDGIRFSNCDALTLTLAADTNYVMDYEKAWRGADPHDRVMARLDAATRKPYATLLDRHIRDHQELFDRVSLGVGRTSSERASLPTDERIKAYANDPHDPDLQEMIFQFGRYLLIGCSRPGTLPANLQGLWNNSNSPPWSSDYHSNINVQMNYWLAEPANLPECHEPFIALLDAIREPSRVATRAEFGDVRGFTLRTSHNIYGGHGWQWNTPASAWYCQHVWEHYAFGRDLKYLRQTAYPILKEVTEFWEDHLKALPDGTLVAPGGWSPEHGPTEDGVSYDQQIVWDLFTNTIEAAEVLGVDATFRERITEMRNRLLGPKIGSWGQLQEWVDDRDDPDDQHRHTSHLFAAYPGRQISVAQTPELAKAAGVSLAARGETGDSRRSWTWPWRGALWARLLDGEKAHHTIDGLLTYNVMPNLLCIHPPMQMDGNFGITACICEMLLQSHAGEIHLLPALPTAWPDGAFTGLRARGGVTLDVAWSAGRLTAATITSTTDQTVSVRYGNSVSRVTLEAGKPRDWMPEN